MIRLFAELSGHYHYFYYYCMLCNYLPYIPNQIIPR